MAIERQRIRFERAHEGFWNEGRRRFSRKDDARDIRAVDRTIEGELLSNDSEQRLRFTYQFATILSTYDSSAAAQAWLMGLNPELGDRVPICLIREDNLEQLALLVVNAARQYILGPESVLGAQALGSKVRFADYPELRANGASMSVLAVLGPTEICRIAIAGHLLLAFTDDRVCFRWEDSGLFAITEGSVRVQWSFICLSKQAPSAILLCSLGIETVKVDP